jgi:hypothetical protein
MNQRSHRLPPQKATDTKTKIAAVINIFQILSLPVGGLFTSIAGRLPKLLLSRDWHLKSPKGFSVFVHVFLRAVQLRCLLEVIRTLWRTFGAEGKLMLCKCQLCQGIASGNATHVSTRPVTLKWPSTSINAGKDRCLGPSSIWKYPENFHL